MTTIYELEKQATPGPWGAQLNGREIYPHPSPPGTRIAELSRRDLSPEGVHKPFGEDKQAGANSKLLLHCRNNFMKALEALKAEHEYASQSANEAYGITHGAHKCLTCELIKELEEV